MEFIIIAILLLIAVETSYLTITGSQKRPKAGLAPVFVDTSVLIDGRIISIAESGFITRPLLIPRSVVGELQFMADNADNEKRARARHGLDVINQLQALTTVSVVIFADGVRAEEGVDNRLLTLAKKHAGALCTIDYNLNKVAVVEGIQVLNVNELARTLRMAYLPGEKMTIHLAQKGNDQHQAVGHLADGTMVVVEQAYKYIGNDVEVEFIRSLQTAAGKMLFAKLVKKDSGANDKASKRAAVKRPSGKKPQQRLKAQTPSQGVQKRTSSRKQKRTPEDSLVDLANQS
ncbi:TPA: hypothetical protein DD425_01235 [Candidatus Saccharibacteria bacterium]|nr:hypothetical protein [Candidatus Saccharibacteria bacterium]|tara:strand:+ start:351 stop:1217 length:867 start_codon:yes stop_codon:yes gene_type:complete